MSELKCIEWADGSKWWYLNGQLHRIDGPAVEWASGYKAWFQNDERHRLDGPAAEYFNGDKRWFLNGKELTQEEHLNSVSGEAQIDILFSLD